MRVTIVGGGLQGVELCWLARKAGWETLLVDSRSAPPGPASCGRVHPV